MKRLSRTLGVTLLEIMLVLAIAAMIIVMSIRYYSTATSSQQANAMFQTVAAIQAAADNLAQGTGTYSQVTSTNISNIVGASSLQTQWNTTYKFQTQAGTGGASSYTATIGPIPTSVCTSILGKLASGATGSHYTAASCTAAGAGGMSTLAYTYNALPT